MNAVSSAVIEEVNTEDTEQLENFEPELKLCKNGQDISVEGFYSKGDKALQTIAISGKITVSF